MLIGQTFLNFRFRLVFGLFALLSISGASLLTTQSHIAGGSLATPSFASVIKTDMLYLFRLCSNLCKFTVMFEVARVSQPRV